MIFRLPHSFSFSLRLSVKFWRVIYKPIFRKAARQILRGRLLDENHPENGRWLEPDIRNFLNKTWEREKKLLPVAKLEKLPNTGARHNVFLAVLTTSAYQVMNNQIENRQYAQLLIADIGWKVYRWMLKIVMFPFKIIYRNPGKRIEKVLKALMIFPFYAPGKPGYEAKIWTEGEDTYTYWTHCPPQTFVRQLIKEYGDNGELDAFFESWCRYDWPGADLIADDGKKGHYTREHTLSRGDLKCDMCWHGKSRQDL